MHFVGKAVKTGRVTKISLDHARFYSNYVGNDEPDGSRGRVHKAEWHRNEFSAWVSAGRVRSSSRHNCAQLSASVGGGANGHTPRQFTMDCCSLRCESFAPQIANVLVLKSPLCVVSLVCGEKNIEP